MDHDGDVDQNLTEWASAVARELGLESAVTEASTGEMIAELSSHVASGVGPAATPTTAYLIGVAAGRTSDPGVAARDFVQQVTHLADGWNSSDARGVPANDQSQRA